MGQGGTINVVLAKSDSAALGVYGIAVRRITRSGPGEWHATVFDDPQGAATRRAIMRIIGTEVTKAGKDRWRANREDPDPVHLVVPDGATADVLVSIADNLAGVELSRLRWVNDRAMGRPALTFDGEPADIPAALTEEERTGVSFLLEEDRGRALALRTPVVDLRAVLARHVVAGGPAVNALRLDYLVAWAAARPGERVEHRALSDEIEAEIHTPGARLTGRRSNAIHAAFIGTSRGDPRPARPQEYAELIRDELGYKAATIDAGVVALEDYPASTLRTAHRAVEGDAQAVWRRRRTLHASDLVRFGRTYRFWRNGLVPVIEADDRCNRQLLALSNPQSALDSARDAGTRHVAMATVVGTSPLVLLIESRRIGHGDRIVLLLVNGMPCVEDGGVTVTLQGGSFKIGGLSIGPLSEIEGERHTFRWAPAANPPVRVGDRLVVASFAWFGTLKRNTALPVDRPAPDTTSAPRKDCTPSSFAEDPVGHRYCCRPHEDSEAEWSNTLAARRSRGELNPAAWPPVADADGFEIAPSGTPTQEDVEVPVTAVPDDVTADDLD